MKVLDLRCTAGHTFEGWFASEEDFLLQLQRSGVQCPICGSPEIHKILSAPRLNLSGAKEPQTPSTPAKSHATIPAELPVALQEAWMNIARHVVAHTDDVGDRFAEEARRMHYGETEERGIRGTTSRQEVQALVEEGIEILPLLLPEHLKNPLQ